MPPSPQPRTRRRTALGLLAVGPATLAATALSGCDVDPRSPREGAGSTAGTTPEAAPTPSDEETDEAVLGQAVAAARNAAALVTATSARHPALVSAGGKTTRSE